MKNYFFALVMLAASLSFAGGTDVGSGSAGTLAIGLVPVMTCNGTHEKSGNKIIIQAFESSNQKGKGLVTVGQKGDSNQFPYEATIVNQVDYVSFDLEWVKGGLELGGEVSFAKGSVVSGVKFETNNKDLAEISFVCSYEQ